MNKKSIITPKVISFYLPKKKKKRSDTNSTNKIDTSLKDLSKQLNNISINDKHKLKIIPKTKTELISFDKNEYQTICSQGKYSTSEKDTLRNIYQNESFPVSENHFYRSDIYKKHISSFSLHGNNIKKNSSNYELIKENDSLKEKVKFLLNQIKEYNNEKKEIINKENEDNLTEIKKEFENKIEYYLKEIKILKEQNNKLKAENKELQKLIYLNTGNKISRNEYSKINNIDTINPELNYSKLYEINNNNNKKLSNLNCISYCGFLSNSNSLKKGRKRNYNINNNTISNINISGKNDCTINNSNYSNPKKCLVIIGNNKNNINSLLNNKYYKEILNRKENMINPMVLYKKTDDYNNKMPNIKKANYKKLGYISITPSIKRKNILCRLGKSVGNKIYLDETHNYSNTKILGQQLAENIYFNLRNSGSISSNTIKVIKH